MTSPTPYGIVPSDYRLPATTALGAAVLQVADLSRSVAYYRDVIGLRVLIAERTVVQMSPHDDDYVVVELREVAGITPVPTHGRLGLYHVAIRLPDRASLGRFLAHLAAVGVQPGMSDHLVSEALYLTDPDGFGLEVYADRDRALWQLEHAQLRMGSDPLDVRSVLAAGNGERWTGAPVGTRVGHMHLHVGDIPRAATFYHEGLGFDKIVWSFPGALFLSAGGYHHHVGTNTWARGAMSAQDSEAKLVEWNIILPTERDVRMLATHLVTRDIAVTHDNATLLLTDPWGTRVRVYSAAV